jgi:hypothetical protein
MVATECPRCGHGEAVEGSLFADKSLEFRPLNCQESVTVNAIACCHCGAILLSCSSTDLFYQLKDSA